MSALLTDMPQYEVVAYILYRCDRALYYFKADDPKSGEKKSIISYVRYDEVVDGKPLMRIHHIPNAVLTSDRYLYTEPVTEHFKRIHGWCGYDYTDMVSLRSFLRKSSTLISSLRFSSTTTRLTTLCKRSWVRVYYRTT